MQAPPEESDGSTAGHRRGTVDLESRPTQVNWKSYRVLIVDDDPSDRLLIEEAFKRALDSRGTVVAVNDGEDAIRYLQGRDEFSDRSRFPFPTLIMLDLKMPRLDGFGVLLFLQRNPAWAVIPRIVFSASDDEDDIKKSYLVGATAYHHKPMEMDALLDEVASIVNYWRRCQAPPIDPNGRLLMTNSRGKLGERIPQPEGGDSMQREV